MKKSVIALLLVGLFAIGIVSAFGWNMQNREEIRASIEANDFGGWKEAMSKGFTEERFNQMRERHQDMAAVHDALEQGDYDAWAAAISGTPMGKMSELIDEGNFDTFVEFHEARAAGDLELAQELAGELGLPGPGKGGFGRGMGRHGGCMMRR